MLTGFFIVSFLQIYEGREDQNTTKIGTSSLAHQRFAGVPIMALQ